MASPKTLTTEESETLLLELLWHPHFNRPARKGIRNHTIALLMLDAGLRVGEVVQMQSRDLYFNCQPVTSITIRPAIAKNNTERTIPVSQRLTTALGDHANASGGFNNLFHEIFVFRHGQQNCHLTTRQVERIIRLAAMVSLGRPIHPHVLRHTFASRLMRKTNVRVVQELLGHKHLTSTQVYTHPNGEDLKEAINSLNNVDSTLSRQTTSGISPPGVPNGLNAAGTNRDVR